MTSSLLNDGLAFPCQKGKEDKWKSGVIFPDIVLSLSREEIDERYSIKAMSFLRR